MKGFISVICHEGRAEAAVAVVGCWWIDACPLPIFRRGFYFVLGLWYNLWRFVEGRACTPCAPPSRRTLALPSVRRSEGLYGKYSSPSSGGDATLPPGLYVSRQYKAGRF